MLIRLGDGQNIYDFIIPDQEASDVADAGELLFRGRSYRFHSLAGGRVIYTPSGPTVLIKEDWLRP